MTFMNDKIKEFEVMAPVGSRESLAAAIQAGADSVYFGIGKLNIVHILPIILPSMTCVRSLLPAMSMVSRLISPSIPLSMMMILPR